MNLQKKDVTGHLTHFSESFGNSSFKKSLALLLHKHQTPNDGSLLLCWGPIMNYRYLPTGQTKPVIRAQAQARRRKLIWPPMAVANPTKKYKESQKVLKVFYPNPTLFSMRNFKLAVDLNPKLEKTTCTNIWTRDIHSTHVRNKRFLDLPFPKPNCCMEVYNVTLDRLKLNKLKKYNMTRPVRSYSAQRQREAEERKQEKVPRESYAPQPPTVIFPECYIVSESSDSDDSLVSEVRKEESEAGYCTICRDPDQSKKRRKLRRFTRLVRQMNRNALAICKNMVKKEIAVHKSGADLKLKLKKVF